MTCVGISLSSPAHPLWALPGPHKRSKLVVQERGADSVFVECQTNVRHTGRVECDAIIPKNVALKPQKTHVVDVSEALNF